jgi:prophage DNA circulation protein
MLTIPTPWQLTLLPASWRGFPFGVLETSTRGGRRVADHQYPFRDIPWREDLGRRGRSLPITGFVVGDVAGLLALQLMSALEVKGPGMLVHPVYGPMLLQVAEFETSERWDNGRVIEFRFLFLEPGALSYPTTPADTQAQTASATAQGNADASTQYQSTTGQQPLPARSQGTATGAASSGTFVKQPPNDAAFRTKTQTNNIAIPHPRAAPTKSRSG